MTTTTRQIVDRLLKAARFQMSPKPDYIRALEDVIFLDEQQLSQHDPTPAPPVYIETSSPPGPRFGSAKEPT